MHRITIFTRFFHNSLRSLRYRGDAVQCPVCGGRFRHFIPGGNDRRPNSRCPFCDSLERHRFLWLYLKRDGFLFSRECTLLHLAPEYCLYRAFKKLKNINYTSADIASPLAEIHTDITSLIFRDNSFDFIICSHVLEHIPDDKKALMEMRRVLKPAGRAVIMAPVDTGSETTREDTAGSTPELRQKLFGAQDHVRIYGKDIMARLEGSGFSVECIDIRPALDGRTMKYHALENGEEIFMCRKT